MFGRGKPQPFDITEHPDVIKALEAMWQQAYDAGRRDALAIAKDLYEEEMARGMAADDTGSQHYRDGIAEVIDRLWT